MYPGRSHCGGGIAQDVTVTEVGFHVTAAALDGVGCTLAAQVHAQYTRYVAFRPDLKDEEADLLVLWTLHTHTFGAAEVTPYILVTAPTPEAGKSRIIDVAELLAARAEVVVDPTPAALFRMIDEQRPTLLIDELDEAYKSSGLRAVLNAGYRLGATVRRASREYAVFCPKLLAGISAPSLPLKGATLSRCIELRMRRRAPGQPVDRFSRRVARLDCDEIRRELADWGEAVEWQLAETSPCALPHLSDRQREVWEPLASIAELLGERWPSRVYRAADKLSRRIVKQPDQGTQIIADLHDVWRGIEGTRAHTATLAAMRNQLEGRRYSAPLSAHELSQRLKPFDIHPHPNAFRVGGKLGRGYYRSAFDDAFVRYL